jgi:hypothetical protein
LPPHGRPASFLRVAPGFLLGAAAFLARFSERVLTAPWRRFVLEVNPVGWTRDAVVAVDGLLIFDPGLTRRQGSSVLTTIVPPLFVD